MSEVIAITGGRALHGEVETSGAKNAVLPLLITSLLTSEECIFENVPALEDVTVLLKLLEQLGAETSVTSSAKTNSVTVRVPQLVATEASYSLVKSLRASFWVLAPLLARGGAARVALPGGDMIGARPVDLHLAGLQAMGAEISVKHGVVYALAPHGLKPADISLRFPSVGATHQLVMAASLTPGETIIRGAAREPEVVAVCDFLHQIGAQIRGQGSETISIRGASQLGGGRVRVIGDRIEAGTFLLGAVATRGRVKVNGIAPGYLDALTDLFGLMNAKVCTTENSIEVDATSGNLRPVSVVTAPFPGFPTDLQAPLMAALCTIPGESRVNEQVFEARFRHATELCRLGADISIAERTAVIRGGRTLSGAQVEAHDIRAAVALALAGLAAEGVTTIGEPHHLRRGYEKFEIKMKSLGALVGVKVTEPEDFLLAGC